MILFNNKEILMGNRPFFLKDWFDSGIVFFQDILSENGKFLSFQEFQQIYKIKCNFLSYYQVVSAIPKHLLERAKQTQLNKTLFLDSENLPIVSFIIDQPYEDEKLGLLVAFCKEKYPISNCTK